MKVSLFKISRASVSTFAGRLGAVFYMFGLELRRVWGLSLRGIVYATRNSVVTLRWGAYLHFVVYRHLREQW
jgi:hypothetical protein